MSLFNDRPAPVPTESSSSHSEPMITMVARGYVARPATSHGWLKRPELGPDIWEMPNGQLHQTHSDVAVPVVFSLKPWAQRGTP